MAWARMLAYITGTVDKELLLRNEYLTAENRILRGQIKGRARLNDGDRTTLAEIGKRLGCKALAEVAGIVSPDTILEWHRKLVARKFDGSKHRTYPGRPAIDPEIEKRILQMARENRSWGYDRIVGALANLGLAVSDQTVGNILKRHGLPPTPERKKTTTWKEFVRSHLDVLAATDFFTAEVWTAHGLISYYVLFVIHLATRRIHVAGITPNPEQGWMMQIGRNLTMADCGFLSGFRYLILDRDAKFVPAFRWILATAGVRSVLLPAHSPNLNAYAERFVRSIKEECLGRMIVFGEASLRHIVSEYVAHYDAERNHQGRDNALLFPFAEDRVGGKDGRIERRERLGGLLKFYRRIAG